MPNPIPRPIAFDVRADGTDYRVCAVCIRTLRFADAIAEPVFKLRQGEVEFCEECDEALVADGGNTP